MVIQGRYTVALQAGGPGPFPAGHAAISETGTIPANALSIMFEASMPFTSGWTITVGGTTLPVVQLAPVQGHPGFFLYGSDVSTFAGRIEELRFTDLSVEAPMYLDAIQFSSVAVPEPSPTVLMLVGVLLGLVRIRKRCAVRE